MEKTYTMRQIREVLDLPFSTERVEQWISRGLFQPEHNPQPGIARQWSFREVVKLVALAEAADWGVNPKEVSPHFAEFGARWKSGPRYLVIFTGIVKALIPATPRGGHPSTPDELLPVDMPGQKHSDIVKEEDLLDFLRDPNKRASMVVKIDDIEDRVWAAWETLGGRG